MRIAIHDFSGHPFVFELSRALAHAGHAVGHFFFADYPGPKGEGKRSDTDPAGLEIFPLSIDRPYSTQKMMTRLRGNLAYADKVSAAIRAFRPDIVLSGNAPTEVQGRLMAATHAVNARFVYWMQDFYSLAVGSLLQNRWLGAGRAIGAVYRHFDRRHLRDCDGIILISESFRDELASLGRIDTPIWTIPNWGAIAEIDMRPKNNPWARAQGLTERFVYLYSGTLGLKHDPMLLLQLARAIEKDPGSLVVVAAQGAGRVLLERKLEEAPQANLRLLDLQPLVDFPDMMGGADAMIALLESDAGRFSVPSKVLSYLCAGRPIVISAPLDNLASEAVRDAGAGLAVAPSDPDAFIEAALSLRSDSAAAAKMGQNGRAYAENHFQIRAITERFLRIFGDLTTVTGWDVATARPRRRA